MYTFDCKCLLHKHKFNPINVCAQKIVWKDFDKGIDREYYIMLVWGA